MKVRLFGRKTKDRNKKNFIKLDPLATHLWQAYVPDFFSQKNSLMTILNEEELQIARRFKSKIDQTEFILKRALLRKTLSFYTDTLPKDIEFISSEDHKLHLCDNPLNIEFSLSQSREIVVFAITKQNEIGIAIKKMRYQHKDMEINFLSSEELSRIKQLPLEKRILALYQTWVKKESVTKIAGIDFKENLTSFSIQWDQPTEKITINDSDTIYLYGFHINQGYLAALATLKPANEITHWQWKQKGYERLSLPTEIA